MNELVDAHRQKWLMTVYNNKVIASVLYTLLFFRSIRLLEGTESVAEKLIQFLIRVSTLMYL